LALLHCHIYDHERAKLAVQLKTIDESFDLLHLLTRDSNKEKHQKKLTYLEEFIKGTGLFPELRQALYPDHEPKQLNTPVQRESTVRQ
jgi:hypothetical protein